jgi:hypothetical protein
METSSGTRPLELVVQSPRGQRSGAGACTGSGSGTADFSLGKSFDSGHRILAVTGSHAYDWFARSDTGSAALWIRHRCVRRRG